MSNLPGLLSRAAATAYNAATACRTWEHGGDSGPVADSAWEANEAISEAVRAAWGIDPALQPGRCPETRLGRLVLAARLLALAGTDEGGRSEDLELAAHALRLAADEV